MGRFPLVKSAKSEGRHWAADQPSARTAACSKAFFHILHDFCDQTDRPL
jgi:hypothetical protein